MFQVPASYVNSLVRSRPVTSTALSLVSLLECKRSPRPQRRSVPAVTSPRRWDPVLGYCFDFWFDFGIFVFIKPDSKRTMLSNILRTLARALCGSSEGTNLESARAGTGTEGHGAAIATSESVSLDCHVPGSRLQLLHAALGRARRACPRPVAGRTLRGILKLPPTTRRAGGTGSLRAPSYLVCTSAGSPPPCWGAVSGTEARWPDRGQPQ